MYNTSEELALLLEESGRDERFRARLRFPDLEIDDSVIVSIEHDSNLVFENDFEIGTAPMDMVKIDLVEGSDEIAGYENYPYEGKECELEIGAELSDGFVEYVPMGKFTIEKVTRTDNRLNLNGIDRMYKAEKGYVNNLMYPTTLWDILNSAIEQAGLTLATSTFTNMDHVVPNEPVFEGVTCRSVIAQVAELAGGYAGINRQGELEILTLSTVPTRTIADEQIPDGKFQLEDIPPAKIEKVIVKVGEEQATAGEGENIYTIVDNMFVQDPAEVVDSIYGVLKNVIYAPYKLEWMGDFRTDVGDKIVIGERPTYVLSRNYKYDGGFWETYEAPVKTNIERESTGKGNLTIDIENVKTQIKVIDGEIQQTVERVENLVVGASNRLFDSQTNIELYPNRGMAAFTHRQLSSFTHKELVFRTAGDMGKHTTQLFRDKVSPYYKVTGNQEISLYGVFPDSQFAEPLSELGEVTVSLDVMTEVDRVVRLDKREFPIKGNRWTRIHVTKTFDENTTGRVRVRVPFSRKFTRDTVEGTRLIDELAVNTNIIYYRNLQVEQGNIPSSWTLTPEELEADVNRYSSEIRQLADSISVIARKNESTGKLEVTPESIVATIDKTDGVGKVKNVGVTIDERGLEIENGALTIRDVNNTAIITSDGLKFSYIYTSSGELNGFQKVGIWSYAGMVDRMEANFNITIPTGLVITSANLIVKSMPSYQNGWPDIPNGFYHARNLRILVSNSPMDGFVDYPYNGTYSVAFLGAESDITDITDSVWGGAWSPTGRGIKEKTADVIDWIESGDNTTFMVLTADPPVPSNERYLGGLQFVLALEGFLRG